MRMNPSMMVSKLWKLAVHAWIILVDLSVVTDVDVNKQQQQQHNTITKQQWFP